MHVQLEELNIDNIKKVQLLRTGQFKHGLYGRFDITQDTLRSLKKNFDTNVRRVKLAVDYFHEAYEEAAGWIDAIELRNNDNELWIEVDWTDKAQEMILAKEVRYISADLDMEYEDSESGKQYGATLLGAGLTNRPFIKDMKAILSEFSPTTRAKIKEIIFNDNNNGVSTMSFEQILNTVSTLSDDQKAQLAEKLGDFAVDKKKLSEKETEVSALNAKLSESETKQKTLQDKVDELNKKLSESEKTAAETKKKAEFDLMLSEGKVVEAQRGAYMKGDFNEFAKNAVAINLSESGVNATEENSSDAEAAVKKLNELAEEAVEKTGKTFTMAFKEVVKANPELAKKAGH